jgi:transcriptional regulator with XRE-family HTH domain
MALVVDVPLGEVELSNAEKYRRLREKDRVELKLISKAGAPATWVGGRIKNNVNKGGAYCRTDTGLERFFHWSEMRAAPDDFDPAKPFGTLKEIARGVLRAVPSEPEPSTAAPQSSAERPASLLISREDLGMPKKVNIVPMQRRAATRSTERRTDTAIGEFLRNKRHERNWSQRDVAKAVSGPSSSGQIWNTRVSKVEMGHSLPTDDELLSYAELYSIELEELMALRAKDERKARRQQRARGSESAESVVMPRAQQQGEQLPPPPTPAPAPETKTLSSRPEEPPVEFLSKNKVVQQPVPLLQADLAAFTDHIAEISPIPIDADRRRVWVRLVVELFQLQG